MTPLEPHRCQLLATDLTAPGGGGPALATPPLALSVHGAGIAGYGLGPRSRQMWHRPEGCCGWHVLVKFNTLSRDGCLSPLRCEGALRQAAQGSVNWVNNPYFEARHTLGGIALGAGLRGLERAGAPPDGSVR